MAGFKAALINEVEKLYKKKKACIAMILSLFIIVIGQVVISGVRNNFGLRTVGSMEFPILVLSFMVNFVMPLFTALITIESFSGEFAQNTMKLTITKPITRLKLFTAKIVAVLIFIFSTIIFSMIFSTIAGIIFNSNSFTFQGILRIIICHIVTILPMMVLALLIVTLANIMKNGISTFFVSIIVFITFKVFEIIFSRYSGLFFTSMMDWYNLWIMSTFPLLKIFRQFIMMCSYVIILFTLSYYLFDKKEF